MKSPISGSLSPRQDECTHAVLSYLRSRSSEGVVPDAALFSLNASVFSSSWISPDAMMMGLYKYSVLNVVAVELFEVIIWRLVGGELAFGDSMGDRSLSELNYSRIEYGKLSIREERIYGI